MIEANLQMKSLKKLEETYGVVLPHEFKQVYGSWTSQMDGITGADFSREKHWLFKETNGRSDGGDYGWNRWYWMEW